MAATISAKDYVDSLSPEEFKKVSSIKDTTSFYLFLAEPCKDAIKSASLAAACDQAGIPEVYWGSSEALHHLVVAISNHMNGNA